jgi:isopenicillin-N N-acyltransferase-like protein
MFDIRCEGTPYEIGLQHGKALAPQIQGSIEFYTWMFKKYTAKDWKDILVVAKEFQGQIRQRWPRYYEEITGIAAGADRQTLDIVALNVRTEIAYGLLAANLNVPSDGCTTVYWNAGDGTFLGQNWDWMEAQKANAGLMTLISPGLPTIKVMTEAGIIGKIGMNSSGVGICMNAIRAKGYNSTQLPVHIAMRMALECRTASQAAEELQTVRVAGSVHLLVADVADVFSFEFTSQTCIRLHADTEHRIIHSNHLIEKHAGSWEDPEDDSFARLSRMKQVTDEKLLAGGVKSLDTFQSIFDDHKGFPVSICRFEQGISEDATLFNIVMDLGKKNAIVTMGKLCQPDGVYRMAFDA